MAKLIDVAGRTFGRLSVIERKDGKWRCLCECGNETLVTTHNLTSGNTKSCGCLEREAKSRTGKRNKRHGAASRLNPEQSRLYRVWINMRQRCNSPRCHAFHNYGGRGIKVCPEWDKSFEAFRDWALSAGYDPEAPYGKLTLDRIDCNKGYSPNNCRWVDMKVQAHNRRSGRSSTGQYTKAQKAAPGAATSEDGKAES